MKEKGKRDKGKRDKGKREKRKEKFHNVQKPSYPSLVPS
jgi:hypothetical protein